MKINSPSDNPAAISSNAANMTIKTGPNASLLARSGATKSTQSAGVAVTVSPLMRAMATSSGSEVSDIDMEKVASVREAIAQGTYKVNPEAIADKLLSNAQEMLKPTRV
jgi:negative regulator of flagellin synthesis FlgM